MLPGVLLLIFTTRGTPGVIGDSVWYLAAATSVATGGALEVPIAYPPAGQFDADGHLLPRQPFVHWPPGYALLVALVMRATGMSALGAALVVNVVSLAVFLQPITATTGWSHNGG